MLESTLPRIASWFRSGLCRWRLSTWWPNDSRPSMQYSLVRLLAVAHAQRLDPAILVANFAEEHRGGYRRRLRRFVRRLREGTPWVDALEQTPDVLRDEHVLAIRFATQTGTLEPTFQHLINEHRSVGDRNRAQLRQTIFYSAVTLIILAITLGFLTTFIIPLLQQIQQDFGLADTTATWAFDSLVGVVEHIVNFAPLYLLAGLLVVWFVWSTPSRRLFRRQLAGRLVRGVAQSRRAEMLQLLSIALEAGRPMPGAISTMARYHFDRTFRQKLLYARNEIEQGANVWESMSQAQLLSPKESDALANSSSDRSRVWAMRRLAQWNQQIVDRSGETVVTFVQPVVTLFFAAIVLWIGGSMIGFLSQMIHSLAAIG